MDKPFRLAVYIPPAVNQALDALVERRGTSKSEVVTRALLALFNADEQEVDRLMRQRPALPEPERRRK